MKSPTAADVIFSLALVGLIAFVVGLARQVGILRVQLGLTAEATAPGRPPAAEDGPEIGSPAPDLALETINGYGQINLRPPLPGASTVVVFMSPVCEGCHDAAAALREIATSSLEGVALVAIVSGHARAVEAFLSLFPLDMPVVCDAGRVVVREFGVHSNPFALCYRSDGRLMSKGTIANATIAIPALLGRSPECGVDDIFPRSDRGVESAS